MPGPLSRLIGELSRLPGIGPKTATRLAHHLLKVSDADARVLAESILEVKEKLFHCSHCNAITDIDPCATNACNKSGWNGMRITTMRDSIFIQVA